MVLYANNFCLLSSDATEVHGLLMEIALSSEISGMRANTELRKREMMLVGALPFSRSELEAECFYVGGQVIGFVEAYNFSGICHSSGKLILLTGLPRLNAPWVACIGALRPCKPLGMLVLLFACTMCA